MPIGASTPPPSTITTQDSQPSSETVFLGRYRLLQKLGEGGMGEVWLAEQTAPVHRQVAIKVIRAGMDSTQVIGRFEAERQALALMEHPAIAKVFDGGTTPQGRLYFAMEYIRGEPITAYCDRQRLSLEERQALFVQVCEGVQHAHQKGIIHRDLKPSNVLVTIVNDRPVPKIIDFGVAKALAQPLTEHTLFTELGVLIGTPEYMSPEQAEMTSLDVDTRTDVYALGVMFYEILTGARPFDMKRLRVAGLDEIRRVIRQQEPARPSTRVSKMEESSLEWAQCRRTEPARLVGQLRGDLDWIAMKALEKDRTRRYGTVSDLAADVRRHLAHQPVLAGPPSAAYRTGKFIRRHRFGVAAAATLFFLLAVFAVFMAVQAQRVARERDRANREAARANAINAFLLDTLGSANPFEGKSKDVTVLEALKSAAAKLDSAFVGQPDVAGRLRLTIGTTYLRLGLYDEAEPMLRSAIRLLTEHYGTTCPDLPPVLSALAILRQERGDFADAEALYRRALAIVRSHRKEPDQDEMDLLSNLADLLKERNELTEAEKLMRESLAYDRKTHGPQHLSVAMDLNNLGTVLVRQGQFAGSEPLFREAVDILRGTDHAALTIIMGNHGEALTGMGRFVEAAKILENAVTLGVGRLGEKSQDLAKIRVKYASSLLKLKRHGPAEEQVLAALPILRTSLGDTNDLTQRTFRLLIDLYDDWGKDEKAAPYRAMLTALGH